MSQNFSRGGLRPSCVLVRYSYNGDEVPYGFTNGHQQDQFRRDREFREREIRERKFREREWFEKRQREQFNDFRSRSPVGRRPNYDFDYENGHQQGYNPTYYGDIYEGRFEYDYQFQMEDGEIEEEGEMAEYGRNWLPENGENRENPHPHPQPVEQTGGPVPSDVSPQTTALLVESAG